MNTVRRSLAGGWRGATVKAGRFTFVVVVLLLIWLIIGWLVGRAVIAPP